MIGATSLVNVGTAAAADGRAWKAVNETRTRPANKTSRFIARILAYFGASQVVATIVTDVTLSRLTGVALMCRPLIMTVCPLWAVTLNSDTPISRNSFFPAGGVLGMSFGAGALAELGTGSVALVSIHVPD